MSLLPWKEPPCKPPPHRLARVLLALLTLAVAALAPAQYTPPGFDLDPGKPSGGTAVGTGASQYVTNGATRSGYGYGPGCSCSGAISFSWTWHGAGPPPSWVVLKVETTASWTGPSGACSDGLGNAGPPSDSYAGPTLVSQTRSGVAYVLKDSSGGTVAYQVSPTANASGNCSVGATVSLTPIAATVDLSGGLIPDKKELLVGQRLGASVNFHGYQPPLGTTYQWSLSDDTQSGLGLSGECDPFTSWSVVYDPPVSAYPNVTQYHTVYDGYVRLDQQSVSCCFRRPDTVKVQCVVTLPGIGSLTVKDDVSVISPEISNEQKALGVVQIYDHSTPYPPNPYYDSRQGEQGDWLEINGAQLYNPDVGPFGIFYRAIVATPQAYVGKYGDYGGWNYTQTIDSWQAHATDMSGSTFGMSMNGQTGVDGAYPYLNRGTPSNSPWPAKGSDLHRFEDRPGGNIDTFASCTIANSFSVHMLYLPPGGGSQFVPLRGLDWHTNGTATWLGGTVWSSSSCAQGDSGIYNGQPHPSWTQTLAPSWIASP